VKQTKKGSFNEQIFKTVIKYFLAVGLVWPFAGWITGIEYTTSQNFAVVFIFTFWGILVGYLMRRFVNHHIHEGDNLLTRMFR